MDQELEAIRLNINVKMAQDEYGPQFVATCEELGCVTGRTLLELRANLQQAINEYRGDTPEEQYVVLMAFA